MTCRPKASELIKLVGSVKRKFRGTVWPWRIVMTGRLGTSTCHRCLDVKDFFGQGQAMTILRKRLGLVFEFGASAANSVVVQGIGILALPPALYGRFSLVYLVYGFSLSVGLSVICEPWVRSNRHDGEKHFAQMSVVLAFVFGLLAALVGNIYLSVDQAVLLAVAVAFASYRAQARYFAAAMRDIRHVLPADAVSAVLTLAVWLILKSATGGLTALCVAWLVGSALAVALSLRPAVPSLSAVRSWFKTYWHSIRVLWAESSVLDLATYAVPYSLTFTLEISQLAVYLAASSLLIPVRLILVPMRPLVIRHKPAWHIHPIRVAAVVALGAALGLFMWGCLAYIAHLHILSGSTIHELATAFAGTIGVYIAANFISTYYYYVARVFAGSNGLLIRRVAISLLAIALPLVGAGVLGLPGAIWARVIVAAIDAATVIWLVHLVSHIPLRQEPLSPSP